MLAFKPQKLDEVAPQLRAVPESRDGRRLDPCRRRSRQPARSAFPGPRADRPRDAQPAGRDPPRRHRALQRRRRRSDADSSSATCSSALGFAMWTVDEAKLAAIGSVAGAGPAYVARFIAALAKAGESAGPQQRDCGDHRARDGARHGLDGGDQRREHGRDGEPRRQPERDDRGRASPCSTVKRARRAHRRARSRPRPGAAPSSPRKPKPVRLRRLRVCPRRGAWKGLHDRRHGGGQDGIAVEPSAKPVPAGGARQAACSTPVSAGSSPTIWRIIEYDERAGWHDARITARHPFTMDPASPVLHYAQEIFEGMKAYHRPGGRAALFRPDANARRFAKSAIRHGDAAIAGRDVSGFGAGPRPRRSRVDPATPRTARSTCARS